MRILTFDEMMKEPEGTIYIVHKIDDQSSLRDITGLFRKGITVFDYAAVPIGYMANHVYHVFDKGGVDYFVPRYPVEDGIYQASVFDPLDFDRLAVFLGIKPEPIQ